MKHAKWALGAAALVALWWAAAYRVGSFPFDDTFITLRYAENLARHAHLSFNLDDRIDGFTSPGWTLLMALVVRLGAGGERAATLISLGCGLAGVLLSALLALRLGASFLAAIVVAGAGTATMAGWLVWSACGMETPFVGVCALLLLLAYSDGRAMSWPRAIALPLAAAARPECGVLVALFLLYDAKSLRDGGAARLRWLAVVAILVAGFAAHWLYYGKPLPNTYYAKLAGPSPLRRGLADLGEFAIAHGVGLGVLASLWLARIQPRARAVALAFFAWALASFAAYAMAGGDYLDYHRFYQPLVPAAWAMLAAALRVPSRIWIERGLAVAAGAALLVHGAISIRPAKNARTIGSAVFYAERWRKAALALARAYPPPTTMAVRPAGVIPYLTRFRTFDMLGLNTREIALHAGIVRGNDPGHGKEASPQQIVAWKPDIIVGHPMFRETDESGTAPPGTPAQYLAAGYQFRCVPVEAKSFTCVFERPGTPRN